MPVAHSQHKDVCARSLNKTSGKYDIHWPGDLFCKWEEKCLKQFKVSAVLRHGSTKS